MKLIIGLGNPGVKYKNTRHNVGFLVADRLSQTLNKSKILILKSKNFMNESGDFVLSQYTKYHILNTDLYIVHDDLDIKLGEYKIQLGKGPKDHNGLISIDRALGTMEYWHVRVGIDPTSREASRGEDIVLSDFRVEERVILDNVINEICRKLATL